MRSELEDCCFIYALKQTGKFSEEELNLMRLRIKTRYLSQKSIEALCSEFHIKVFVHPIELNEGNKKKTKNVRSNKKNFIGDANAADDKTFYFNLFENHYFIEERTPFTSDYIKHIDQASLDNYSSRLKNGRW
ncbi:MAG: hypothetical protein J6V79_03575, partial [Bacilli bacterium]|nr:hypothetical protein [Bacilli bacterium]